MINSFPLSFWAYRTSRRTSTQARPFPLVYGTETIVFVEVMISSTRLILANKLYDLTIEFKMWRPLMKEEKNRGQMVVLP